MMLYTYEQLEEIADLYGATVLVNNQCDRWRFTLNGPRQTRIGLRFHKINTSIILYCTYDSPFPHPVHPEVIVPSHKSDWLSAANIEVPFQASLHPQPRVQLSLAGYADVLIAKKELWMKQNRRCYYCDRKMRFWDATIDHKTPRDRGGGDMPSNYAIACMPCNSNKGNMTAAEFKVYLERKTLLNRRKSLV